MALTKLTNYGEVAIPLEIREWLNLQPGDALDFVIGSDGKVYLQPQKLMLGNYLECYMKKVEKRFL